MKKTCMLVMIVSAIFLCSSVVYADKLFTGPISQVRVNGDGTVRVIIYDTASESYRGALLTGTEWKAMLAAVLSAQANGSTVQMRFTSEGCDSVEILDY